MIGIFSFGITGAYSASGEISGATVPETFSAALFRKLMLSPCGDIVPARRNQSPSLKTAGKPVIRLEDGFVRSLESWRQWRAAAFSGGG